MRRIWRSIFPRPLAAGTDRERATTTRFTFLLHLRPVLLPARTLRWTHTFGLGGSTLVLVAALAATGILMMLVYQPVPGVAYDSVVTLAGDVAFGPLVRGVHWWSANLLVVVVLLHTARVFATGGYHGPRQFNWVIGAALLLCLLANNFTGYLLPWDQLAYWAVTVGTSMADFVPFVGETARSMLLGGEEVGSATLLRFYVLHVAVLPTVLVGVIALHLWRWRKDSMLDDPGEE